MKAAGVFRWIIAATVLTAMLASTLSFRADAQSEYMRGDRMPYDAFDRLPKTDLDIAGGTIHVAFAPGEITLPKEKPLFAGRAYRESPGQWMEFAVLI